MAGAQPDPFQTKVNIARASKRWPYEKRILGWTIALTVPGLLLAALTLLAVDAPLSIWLFGMLPVTLVSLVFAVFVRNKAGYPLRTLANLVEAIREEDYAMRGVTGPPPGALYELITEINFLSEELREKRFSGIEADLLLSKIVENLDAAVLAFGEDYQVTMANPAALALFAARPADLLGRHAESLGLLDYLEYVEPRVEQRTFPGQQGRFRIQAAAYRESGVRQHLLVLTDLSLTLRQEERLAWQRLIRVIGHELNNSLAPIRSMAESLASLLGRDPRPSDWDADAMAGLEVIKERAQALSSFMGSYAQLTRLPPPQKEAIGLDGLMSRIATLESEWSVEVEDRPDITVSADLAQLEQLLINLIKNAGEANQAAASSSPVVVRWAAAPHGVEIEILDCGRGIPDSGNLFTPFFTTKSGGSGVGLLLGRQIAEAHGGHLSLSNRSDGVTGCIARVVLPSG